MRIVRLQVEGFKRLVAVDISPEGDLVALGGDNGEGKSSVLDAIYAAFGGAAAAPMKPVRTGEDHAIIKLDLGDLKVTRYFGADGTDKLKVENAEGAVFTSAQTMLDKLVGKIAFDPLAFAKMDPDKQAAELRRLVPLAVDIDEVARLNAIDYTERRDVNREGKTLRARIDAIIVPADLGEKPDREALTAALASAADTNGAIERDRIARGIKESDAKAADERAAGYVDLAARLRKQADEADQGARTETEFAAGLRSELGALPPLGTLVDTAKLRDDLAAADRVAELFRRAEEKAGLLVEFEALKAKSEGFTATMAERSASVEKALAEAEMPIEGLSLARLPDPSKPDEPGPLIVTFNGEPFAQSSTAEQIRVSARLAMAMNPKLRVMVVKEGAMLDGKGLTLLSELAAEGDFQVWLETVGERDGVGIIMEAGKVRGAPDPEALPAPKRRKAKSEGDEPDAPGVTEETVAAVSADLDAALGPKGEERRPRRAMREITTPTPQGGLFGGDE